MERFEPPGPMYLRLSPDCIHLVSRPQYPYYRAWKKRKASTFSNSS
jgi:hypothetical protein